MGRHDFSRMVPLFFLKIQAITMKSMKRKRSCNKRYYSLLLAAAITIGWLISQPAAYGQIPLKGDTSAAQAKPKPASNYSQPDVLYQITIKDSWNIYRTYKLNEATEISRTYSDNSVKTYKRDDEIYFTLTYRNPPSHGFFKVDVSVDSMIYKFTEGEATIEFNSNSDQNKPIHFKDLEAWGVPVGRAFEMTYSSYKDVAKLEGEDLEWLRNYINEQGKGIVDTLTNFIWLQGISEERLTYITDLYKVYIPDKWIPKDSVWTSPFDYQINGIPFQDTVFAKVSDATSGFFTVEAKTNKMAAIINQPFEL